jgi:hypothetical protein
MGDEKLLERVRKLLAKAEAEGVTAQEAEALTAKAAELMARYGIDRARLGALHPETDQPASRIIDIDNPWAQVRAHLLAGLAGAMRCQVILLNSSGPGARIHVFGYASDLERTDILYTSLLLQMAHGLTAAVPPAGIRSPRAWRRSCSLSSRRVDVLATTFRDRGQVSTYGGQLCRTRPTIVARVSLFAVRDTGTEGETSPHVPGMRYSTQFCR